MIFNQNDSTVCNRTHTHGFLCKSFSVFLFLMFWAMAGFGQQWNGPSNTNGGIYRLGNVGIGYSSVMTPQARLDINYATSSGQEGEDVLGPHIRLNRSNGVWDITGGSVLEFAYGSSISNTSSKLTISSNTFDYKGNLLRVGTGENRFNIGSADAPNSNPGHYLAFGANSISSSGGWSFTGNSTNNGGAIIHSDNKGNLFFITRSTDASNNMSVSETAQNIKMQIHNNGKISIGTTSTATNTNVDGDDYLLFVTGGTLSDEVTVESGWADYVFETDYNLLPLEEVEQHIDIYGHLHNTPSATDLNGKVNLGNATVQQQEKIEEIYLHLIDMNKEIKALKAENEQLKQEIENLK